MKKLLLVLAIAAQVFALQSKEITASGGSPIPSSYSASNTQSKVLTGLNGVFTVCVYNPSAGVVAFAGSTSSEAPSDTGANAYVPPTAGRCADMQVPGAVYIRGIAATTSGVFYIDAHRKE